MGLLKKIMVTPLIAILTISLIACGEKEDKKITEADVNFNYEIMNKETGEVQLKVSFSEGLPAITYDIYENDKVILAGDHQAGETKSVGVSVTQTKGEKYKYRVTVKDDKGNKVEKELHLNVFATEEGSSNESETTSKETPWNNKKTEYKVGDLVSFNGKDYECIQGHTSQDSWTPIDAPSLWKLKSEE